MKNWEVEAILKFYKDIDLDIKVTGEWLERYESVYDTTGAINYDGMPHGSNTSDSTALLAIEIAGTDTAERIFKKVIGMNPDNALAHKDLGVIYLNKRLFDYTKDEFKTALNLAPDNYDIVFE